MSIRAVRKYLENYHVADRIQEFSESSATVELAAQALSVIPGRIAKTLSFKKDDTCLLVVAAGDKKIDNQKFKAVFGCKAKMLDYDAVLQLTGHAPGGVCPFALPAATPVYLDVSLKQHSTVFPACGTSSSAIELSCDELFSCSQALEWVDVCK